MYNIFLIVEGDTEESFYKNVFQEHYKGRIVFSVTKMPSKRNLYKRDGKGGRVSYQTFLDSMKRYLSSATHCQKIIFIYDYYGLDKTFKDHFNGSENTLDLKIESIKKRLESAVANHKFSIFLQVHEFEALLFSNPEVIANHFNDPIKVGKLTQQLEAVNYNPELINDNIKTAPSKRLIELFPQFEYGKTSDGVIIASKIGIQKMKEMCPHFRNFCESLEK
jgi:hypothetical protein